MDDKKSEDNIEINNNEDINKFPEEKTKNKKYPKMEIRKILILSDSIINYFSIGLCLFLHSAYELNWFDPEKSSEFLFTYFIFTACLLYIIGIMNWYEGKELLFLFDFIISFYFLSIYFKKGYFNNLLDIKGVDIIDNNNKLQAIFYLLLFCLFFILGLSAFKKGWIYIINYFILFLGFVFLFIDFYLDREYDRIKKIHCYIFIVSGAIMWVIGILKFINQGFLSKDIFLLGQTD
jgi:hypothetical protein